jgi:hypothetical protein
MNRGRLGAAGGRTIHGESNTVSRKSPSRDARSEHELGLFSTESVLNLQKLLLAGSPWLLVREADLAAQRFLSEGTGVCNRHPPRVERPQG